jgi:hypothetical protein
MWKSHKVKRHKTLSAHYVSVTKRFVTVYVLWRCTLCTVYVLKTLSFGTLTLCAARFCNITSCDVSVMLLYVMSNIPARCRWNKKASQMKASYLIGAAGTVQQHTFFYYSLILIICDFKSRRDKRWKAGWASFTVNTLSTVPSPLLSVYNRVKNTGFYTNLARFQTNFDMLISLCSTCKHLNKNRASGGGSGKINF